MVFSYRGCSVHDGGVRVCSEHMLLAAAAINKAVRLVRLIAPLLLIHKRRGDRGSWSHTDQ